MSEEKRIIIDEDWKSQVAAEKAAAADDSSKHGPQPSTAEPASAGRSPDARAHPPLEASFELLVATFVTEAMTALGQMPHPATGQAEFDAAHARFAIDMLDVIAAKTQGNLTTDEERGLREVIHQLRMAFVALSNQPAPG